MDHKCNKIQNFLPKYASDGDPKVVFHIEFHGIFFVYFFSLIKLENKQALHFQRIFSVPQRTP